MRSVWVSARRAVLALARIRDQRAEPDGESRYAVNLECESTGARPDGAAIRLEPRQKDRLALPCRHTRLHAIRLALTQRSYGRTTSFSKKAPAGCWSLFVLAANRSRVSLAAL